MAEEVKEELKVPKDQEDEDLPDVSGKVKTPRELIWECFNKVFDSVLSSTYRKPNSSRPRLLHSKPNNTLAWTDWGNCREKLGRVASGTLPGWDKVRKGDPPGAQSCGLPHATDCFNSAKRHGERAVCLAWPAELHSASEAWLFLDLFIFHAFIS